jgi:aurora kinase
MDIDQPLDVGRAANGSLYKYASNPRLNQTSAPIRSTGTREPTQGSGRERNTNQAQAATTAPATREASMSTIDLGAYDGGLEAENMVRGEVVTGEAAKSLALNSSQSRCAPTSILLSGIDRL